MERYDIEKGPNYCFSPSQKHVIIVSLFFFLNWGPVSHLG